MQLMWYSIYRRNRKIKEVNTRVCGHRQGFKNSLLAFPYHYFRQSDQSNPSVIVRILERRVWRYQGGNQNPYIEEQTTQWSKEKVQKDKQRSTKHTHKTKDRVTRTPLKTGGDLRCLGRTSSSCSTRKVYHPSNNPNLGTLLRRHKSIRAMAPYFKDQSVPIISYSYTPFTSHKIFNYKKSLKIIEGQTTQWPKEKKKKAQTTIYKTLSRKLKTE